MPGLPTLPARRMTDRLDAADRDLIRRLQRLGGASVQRLCEELGVTPTAVRQRLARLTAAGAVERKAVREGRGRPHHAYTVSDRGRRAVGDNYSDLAAVLWRGLRDLPEGEVRQGVIGRIETVLAERYGRDVDGGTVRERVEQLRRSLSEHGFDVEVDARGRLPVLQENHCPYHDLAATDPSICELEQRVFERVLGAPVALTHRCVDGHTCCTFEAGGT